MAKMYHENTTQSKSYAAPRKQLSKEVAVVPSVYIQRLKRRGQAMLIVSLAMLALIAAVALAIDGGSMYNQRRVAQNGADGAAMAGARQMLIWYESMVEGTGYSDTDDDYYPSAAQAAVREDDIRSKIDAYAASNGMLASTVKAYFVDQDKNIVSVNNGEDHGQGHCGTGTGLSKCQVGANGYIPWTSNVRGITIQGQAQTDSFFMRVFGWNKIAATATATAYMGVAVTSGYDVDLLPIGFFTQTGYLNRLQVGVNYTLISGDEATGSGNYGWINYNVNGGNSNVLRAWLECGFNPSVTTDAAWRAWCPGQASVTNAEGPLQYWTGWPDVTEGPYNGVALRFGAGLDGWWLNGNSGAISSACHELRDLPTGDYIVPIFDVKSGGGSNAYYHLYRLAKFTVNPYDVTCNGNSAHFDVQGVFRETFSQGSSGWHGDLRHNSLHLIFMGP